MLARAKGRSRARKRKAKRNRQKEEKSILEEGCMKEMDPTSLSNQGFSHKGTKAENGGFGWGGVVGLFLGPKKKKSSQRKWKNARA